MAAEVVLVWVLVVSSWNSNRNEVEQLGPYATNADCIIIKKSEPLKHFKSECLEVNMVLK